MHVRKPLTPRSKFKFKFGHNIVQYCKTYKYLGLTINQFLNFEQMSNSFTAPASRALSSVICKMIKNKGFPFSIFEMLYNSCVTTISDYSHEVIGFHQYLGSNKIHTKAIRSYIGVGHSAPLCAIRSEMGWMEPRSRTQIRMLRFYFRMKQMSNNRLTKQIFLYDQFFSKSSPNLDTWSNEVMQILSRNNLFFVVNSVAPKLAIKMLQDSLLTKDCANFTKECSKLPKLRTYNHIVSPFISHDAVHYTRLCLPFIVRKRLAQLRLGVLPLRIETDRYKRVKIPPERRFCIQPNCANLNTNFVVEDERHFLICCDQYKNLRLKLFADVSICFPDFVLLSDYEKFNFLLTKSNIAKIVGQFIINAFDQRPIK